MIRPDLFQLYILNHQLSTVYLSTETAINHEQIPTSFNSQSCICGQESTDKQADKGGIPWIRKVDLFMVPEKGHSRKKRAAGMAKKLKLKTSN